MATFSSATIVACGACGLMGALDLLHADRAIGTLRFSTTALTLAMSGALFLIAWLPTRWDRHSRISLPVTALVIGATFGLAAFFLPRRELMPAVDVVGAVGYFAAAPFFVLYGRRERRSEDLAFAGACLLLGSADAVLTWRPLGPACWWLCHGIRLSGYAVLASCVFRLDLEKSMRSRTAELEEERSAREQFVAALAHDLRNPISAASVAAQMLGGEVDEEGQHRYLGRIARSLERVNKMIEDFLDASRISAGHPLPLEIAACDLVAIAREIIDERAVAHRNRLVLDAPPELIGFWWGKGLRRVIENLVGNAIKYGDRDTPVTIAIAARGDRVTLAVHNHGRPLSVREQRHIFAPYSRGHRPEDGACQGWGIGLALVRGTAEAHGGFVRVRSSAGEGTTFIVDLPRDARRPSGPASGAAGSGALRLKS